MIDLTIIYIINIIIGHDDMISYTVIGFENFTIIFVLTIIYKFYIVVGK